MKILALYDFASKQNYIFRTSRIKEIYGASRLLSGMYRQFVEWMNSGGMNVIYELDKQFTLSGFDSDGEVIYDGGGNLMVMFRDSDAYKRANEIVSKELLKSAPTLNMIVSCVEIGDESPVFSDDVRRLYEENTRRKNLYPAADISTVTPFTQTDPMTFRPVTCKGNRYTLDPQSFSSDRVAKLDACLRMHGKFDEINDGYVAVIHMDGNSMGNKLKSISSSDYESGVRRLRQFSAGVRKVFVDDTGSAIEKVGKLKRVIIADGDDMTLMCRAEDALEITRAYFASLEKSECVVPEDCRSSLAKEDLKNTACAGIAIVHAKSPFSLAYELAEAACESAKKKAHAESGNYFDFYYSHSGATADFDTLREREQSMTGRPYAYEDIDGKLGEYAAILRNAGRSNVKALGIAAQLGEKDFIIETERVNAVLGKVNALTRDDLDIVYDLSEFYDLWFSRETEAAHD